MDDYITQTFGLEDIIGAFDLLQRGESIRSVILF
jgi:Zn-dependent alcohol dehydrogenase